MPQTIVHDITMNYEVHLGMAPVDTLFIHGNLGSNRWWYPSLEIWKSQPQGQGRMILAEWRGCGQSGAPASEAELHPEKLADDYLELLSQLGCEKVNLVGHSTGGLIALYALLKRPELFHRAVLLDSVSATGVVFPDEFLDRYTRMSQDREFCGKILNQVIYQNNPKSLLFSQLLDDAMKAAGPVWRGIPSLIRNINILQELPKIQQRVLILHGEYDEVLPISGSQTLAHELPFARFIKLENQGHSTNIENPARFVSLVNEYLFKG